MFYLAWLWIALETNKVQNHMEQEKLTKTKKAGSLSHVSHERRTGSRI